MEVVDVHRAALGRCLGQEEERKGGRRQALDVVALVERAPLRVGDRHGEGPLPHVPGRRSRPVPEPRAQVSRRT